MAPRSAHHLRDLDDWRRIDKQIQEQLPVQSTDYISRRAIPAMVSAWPDHLGRYGGQVAVDLDLGQTLLAGVGLTAADALPLSMKRADE